MRIGEVVNLKVSDVIDYNNPDLSLIGTGTIPLWFAADAITGCEKNKETNRYMSESCLGISFIPSLG